MEPENSTTTARTHHEGDPWLCECALQGKTNKHRCILQSEHLK
jgi:hypothetical protein